MPGQTTKKRGRGDASDLCQEWAVSAVNTAIKDLIDHVIIPNLVEEFIRQYGLKPAPADHPDENSDLRTASNSELNSTP